MYNEGYWCEECFKRVAIVNSHIKYAEYNRNEWIECLECGYRLKELSSHIKHVHNLTSTEYKQKHKIKYVVPSNVIERVTGENNPWFNHGGALSPFSKNNTKITEEQRVENIKVASRSVVENGNVPVSLTYFLKLTNGDEIEAKKLQKERQTTFSKTTCIEKYGEDGEEVWRRRQKKWQNTLNAKSDEEKLRINRLKTAKGYSVSKAEIEIRNILGLQESVQRCIDPNKGYVYDIVDGKKIIEYNGDYWHMNPRKYSPSDFNKRTHLTAEETWKKDKNKIDFAESLEYKVLVIWEFDYKRDKDATIQKCINFLKQ